MNPIRNPQVCSVRNLESEWQEMMARAKAQREAREAAKQQEEAK